MTKYKTVEDIINVIDELNGFYDEDRSCFSFSIEELEDMTGLHECIIEKTIRHCKHAKGVGYFNVYRRCRDPKHPIFNYIPKYSMNDHSDVFATIIDDIEVSTISEIIPIVNDTILKLYGTETLPLCFPVDSVKNVEMILISRIFQKITELDVTSIDIRMLSSNMLSSELDYRIITNTLIKFYLRLQYRYKFIDSYTMKLIMKFYDDSWVSYHVDKYPKVIIDCMMNNHVDRWKSELMKMNGDISEPIWLITDIPMISHIPQFK